MTRPTGFTAKIIFSVVITAYLAFSLWHITKPDTSAKFGQIATNTDNSAFAAFSYLDWIALAVVPITIVSLYLIFRAPRPPAAKFFRSHERYALVFLFIALIIFILCAEMYDAQNKTAMAVMIGALFATAGWIFATYMGSRNAIKAHTMNTLFQILTSAELAKHKTNIQKRFGYELKIPRDDLAKIITDRGNPKAGYENGDCPVGESIRYVLNFYEFISAGVHLEDLDEDLLRETMRSIFINFHHFSEDYISFAVGDDYGKRNDRIYRHYRALVARFKQVPPR